MDDIEKAIHSFLIGEFFPGEDPSCLTESTPLLTSRVLDSVSVLRLVEFLEKKFSVQFESHEVTPDSLDTITEMATLIRRKLEA